MTVGRYTAIRSPDLVDYGIQNEESDLRAHVCPFVQRVYVYPTAEGRRAVEGGHWPTREAHQNGVKGATAIGFCVPPFAIRRCVALQVRFDAWDSMEFSEQDSPSAKGEKAVRFVAGMIRTGIFPLPHRTAAVNLNLKRAVQIRGEDIIVDLGADRVHVQVKCDYRGGEDVLGGTGNLYLQVAERNPLKRI